jgi:hypothetical protein
MQRIEHEKEHDVESEEPLIRHFEGDYDELFYKLRQPQTPNQRRNVLQVFFNNSPPEIISDLPNRLHRICMLLDPISIISLIHILESQSPSTPSTTAALSTSLSYLLSKPSYKAVKLDNLRNILSLPSAKWSPSPTPPLPSGVHTSRRERLRVLRAQWYKAHATPHGKKVRFQPQVSEGYVTASEGASTKPEESVDSGVEQWFSVSDDGDETGRGLQRVSVEQGGKETRKDGRDTRRIVKIGGL